MLNAEAIHRAAVAAMLAVLDVSGTRVGIYAPTILIARRLRDRIVGGRVELVRMPNGSTIQLFSPHDGERKFRGVRLDGLWCHNTRPGWCAALALKPGSSVVVLTGEEAT